MTWPVAYACAPALGTSHGRYALRPIDWADREPIRVWRNAQIDVLRQREPLTEAAQDRYFREIVEPQMSEPTPPQVLVAVSEGGALIGYGGVVHIDWAARTGEVSFLTETTRLDPETFAADWRGYLAMLVPTARDVLGLVQLTTEAYPHRTDLFPLLEEAGFIRQPDSDTGMVRHTRRLARARISLSAYGVDFMSRSEGRLVTTGMEKYSHVIVDFAGVKTVGQGFVDEVFRVWPNQNPGMTVTPENMSGDVEFMVRRGLPRR